MPLLRSSICFCLCVPRVSYRALPSFHPGLFRSAALSGLIECFCLCLPRVPFWALPSFHPGLCRSIALTGLIVVLGVCGVVFVKCVWVCKWIVAFVRVLVCDCIVCGIGGRIVWWDCWCGRVISPNGAILPHSPGRKPWVNHWNTFIEPQRGGTSVRVLSVVVVLCNGFKGGHKQIKKASPKAFKSWAMSVREGVYYLRVGRKFR